MPDYSENSYFAVAKKGTSDKMENEANTIVKEQAKIDPKVKYDKFIRSDRTGDKVYFVENSNAHWIKDPNTLVALGGDFGKVVTVPSEILRTLNLKCEIINMQNVDEYITFDKEKFAEKEQEKTETVQEEKTFEAGEQNAVLRKEGMISYIVILGNFDPIFIEKIKVHINKLKGVGIAAFEVILIANGTSMIAQSPLFNFADKIVTLEKQEDYLLAVERGVRISQGEFPVVVC